MSDLISRQAAIDAVDEALTRVFVEHRDIAEKMINKIPSADLSEYSDKLWKTAYERGKAEAHPKKGKWMDEGGDTVCPFCGFSCDDIYYLHEGNYCPDCGAKLEWEE